MSYLSELTKLAADSPGMLERLGEGIKNLGQLDPRSTGDLGSHARSVWAQEIADQAARLGNKQLGITQKIGPAFRTATSSISKFRDPLMAAAVLAAAAKTVAGMGQSAAQFADRAYHQNPVTHNVYYSR